MKIGSQVLMFAAGAGILGGLYVGTIANAREREAHEIRERCVTIGEVMADCHTLFPDVPVCHEEDCSDISGLVGYRHDMDDDRWYLTRAPWTIDAAQSPAG